jgi:Fe-Mn family superoxide dismutase
VSGVNKALEQYAEAEHKGDVAAMIALQPAIKFNGGGAPPLPLPLPPPPD